LDYQRKSSTDHRKDLLFVELRIILPHKYFNKNLDIHFKPIYGLLELFYITYYMESLHFNHQTLNRLIKKLKSVFMLFLINQVYRIKLKS